MVKAPAGYLRRPAVPGFMAPPAVLALTDLTAERLGPLARDALIAEAQLHRLPGPTEPVREDKVARLHQALQRLHPDLAADLLLAAGQATADALMARQQSARAQSLLTSSPWPIAAWMLSRWATQHAWTFAGSGRFTVVNALEYELADNPLHRGEAGKGWPSHWHVGLIARLFQRLVAPDLECREVECAGTGGAVCRFVMARG